MYLRVQVASPPTQLITASFARQFSRIEYDEDDNLLNLMIRAATKRCEKYMNRSIIQQDLIQTWRQTEPMPSNPLPYLFGNAGILPFWSVYDWIFTDQLRQNEAQIFYGPVTALNAVTVTQWNGNTTTLTYGVDYSADLIQEPATIHMHFGPTFYVPHVAHYQVTYTAGLAANVALVPEDITMAVLLTTTNMYEHRGDDESGSSLTRAARDYLDQYKVDTFGGR